MKPELKARLFQLAMTLTALAMAIGPLGSRWK